LDLDIAKAVLFLDEKKAKELIESNLLIKDQRTEFKEQINEKINKLEEDLEKRFIKKDIMRGALGEILLVTSVAILGFITRRYCRKIFKKRKKLYLDDLIILGVSPYPLITSLLGLDQIKKGLTKYDRK
jgi:hypothetical protein